MTDHYKSLRQSVVDLQKQWCSKCPANGACDAKKAWRCEAHRLINKLYILAGKLE